MDGFRRDLRYKVTIKGTVQGVGFRPFIYNLASSLNIKGFVTNTSSGVEIEAEGANTPLFIQKIETDSPPLSNITSIDVKILPPANYITFEIKESVTDKRYLTFIPPDIAMCVNCRSELYDINDRHYHYPFTNCTNCGPRYSITKTIPYDRKNTTMALFKMCDDCEIEYNNPRDRRFHAQPNACPKCGPRLEFKVQGSRFKVNEDNPPSSPFRPIPEIINRGKGGMGGFDKSLLEQNEDSIKAVVELLKQGAIVGIKGIGGFHIACDAENEETVKNLRKRKRRGNKPFAVMCPDITTAESFAEVDNTAKSLLLSPESPVVLLKKKDNSSLASSVSPNNPYYGIMLPYTPLHNLLFFYPDGKRTNFNALVMTSGNISEEPIIRDNGEALEKLKDICDAFLLHNRDIFMRVDDSVVNPPSPPFTKGEQGRITFIRRSRGYAPNPIKLPFNVPPLLACGAELKSTFTIAKDTSAIVSQHLGDMESYETLSFFEETLSNLKTVFNIEPEFIFYDMHPDYIITKWAKDKVMQGFAVQHHEAHIASCIVENSLQDDVIGIALDGTGYGKDGNIWGGEIFTGNLNDFKRVAHLRYIPMPGGEMAIKEPWRMAVSVLTINPLNQASPFGLSLRTKPGDKPVIQGQSQGLSEDNLDYIIERWGNLGADNILEMIRKDINSPLTSSCGRLFDAAASIIGGFDKASFEAEAAIGLEALAFNRLQDTYSYDIFSENDMIVIDFKNTFKEIAEDMRKKRDKQTAASLFHNTIASGITDAIIKIAQSSNIKNVCLSGGVFQNKIFTEILLEKLKNAELNAFTHRLLPPNDGGISFGQAVIGGWRVRCV